MHQQDQDRAFTAVAVTGPTLSYDVPQTVTYSGQNYIELRLEPECFLARAQPSKEPS